MGRGLGCGEIGVGLAGFIGDGFDQNGELRWHDQIGDGFEYRDQTGGAVGRGLDLGFISDSSLRPSAWAWRE
nr:hypothetical protein CFP56_78779 [Quercus suber]